MPLAENWNFLVLPAAIGGQPVSMLLDSGADAGLVTEEAASRLHLRTLGGRTTLEGTGAAGISARTVLLPELALGDLVLPPHPVPVAALPTEPRVTPPVAGLLGADLLADFDVDIDLPGNRLALSRLAGDCDGFRPWEGAEARARDPRRRPPPRRAAPRRPCAAGAGRYRRALDDSRHRCGGADRGRRRRSSRMTRAGCPAGWTCIPSSIAGTASPRSRSAATRLAGPVVTVAPVNQPVDVLLGADFFAARRVWLSYATSRMFIFTPRSAPAAAASGR